MTIHQNYNQLTDKERDFVDELFSKAYPLARSMGVNLSGADEAERAVEAVATLVVRSRPKPPEPKPRIRVKALRDPAYERELESRAYWKWAGECAP